MYVRKLGNAAQVMLLFAAIVLGGGIATAAILITRTEGDGRYSSSNSHPHVGLGIAVGANAVFLAAALTFVAYWALAWLEVNEKPRAVVAALPPAPTT